MKSFPCFMLSALLLPLFQATSTGQLDNTKITFYSNRDGNNEIYLMNIDGTNQQNLTNNSADDRATTWSPDGSKIGFQSTRDGNWEISCNEF